MIKDCIQLAISIVKICVVQILTWTYILPLFYFLKGMLEVRPFNYLKSLNWIVLLGIAAFCVILAIVNNIRVEDSKSVEWIGSQEILEKPADIL
ncbi:hypothetical protein SAMN05720766_105119 [Fibrobacter sp. UWH9]|uniref:hypothetical protein n=1 Tax=unclassified Fibrobacter TaxID=2634177 RepID=UPI00091C0429|nr:MULTISPECIES: hypothetical protein [Fibrobacter]MCQ2099049.1 hypothetical protein [Fibrobacter sp.]MCL4100790.1 hypothetical protein [Fibrobacter succinogenes]MDO4947597.1 hypothetical protein [Fibrobacter sp.]OWV08204.1 hypothetical protein B7993_00800 [Fibrobacter sp. UWH3]OWV15407.1 hypothetical protein B7992_05020 [Fibrobacter sp. UWH1]